MSLAVTWGGAAGQMMCYDRGSQTGYGVAERVGKYKKKEGECDGGITRDKREESGRTE